MDATLDTELTTVSYLRTEYAQQSSLFKAQPSLVQNFLLGQADLIAEALTRSLHQVKFGLPDEVIQPSMPQKRLNIAGEAREQSIGGRVNRIIQPDLMSALRERLSELENSQDPGLSISAQLMRFAIAYHLVYTRLPSGHAVNYRMLEGEEIPSQPVVEADEAPSALTSPQDAVVLEDGEDEQGNREELVVPYVSSARCFYLPQWVALEDPGTLLVNSVAEAESYQASMQQFLAVLHSAVSIAPYIIADKEYQRKRYGMLGQCVNQGRALALYHTGEIVQTIRARSAANDLNRGLSVSLPYFDDQALQMKSLEIEVIPAGRIMFVPAFVVRAMREEQAKVAQDTRMNKSTRKYLLNELKILEQAFLTAGKPA
jgi:hypothetical protein